jgi:hypothetical protein
MKYLTLIIYEEAAVRDVEICRMYWAQPERPTKRKPYLHRVAEVARRFGMSLRDVGAAAARAGFTIEIGRECRRCGEHSRMDTRAEFDRLCIHLTTRSACTVVEGGTHSVRIDSQGSP